MNIDEILRAQVGSGLHGVVVEGTDDRDEMGVCIEPPEYVIGLKKFEQYEYRTKPTGVRSGPGDLDVVVYSLKKWARLAAQGNPTVLLLLFVPEEEIVTVNELGQELRSRKDLFLSRDCGRRFLGYLDSQRDQLLGLKSKYTNRPELIEQYGYDTKFAYHALRLGYQGNQLILEHNITLPIPEPTRTWLHDVRTGKVEKSEVLECIEWLRESLDKLTSGSAGWLPDHADRDAIDKWLIKMYKAGWEWK